MHGRRMMGLKVTGPISPLCGGSDAGSEREIDSPYLSRQNSSDDFIIGAHQHVMRLNGDSENRHARNHIDLHYSHWGHAIEASRRDMTHEDPDLARAIAASQQPRGRNVISHELMRLALTAGIEEEVLLAMSLEEANTLLGALRSDTSAAAPSELVASAPTIGADELDAYLAAHTAEHNRVSAAQAASQHPVISEALLSLEALLALKENICCL
jgi:hypothetical protein